MYNLVTWSDHGLLNLNSSEGHLTIKVVHPRKLNLRQK